MPQCLPDGDGDPLRTAQPPVVSFGSGFDFLQFLFRGGQQLSSLARTFGGEQGIATGNQTFARECGVSDFSQVRLVEERQLQCAISRQFLDGRRA